MNLPSRGGLLFLALAAVSAQESPPTRPDLAARYATILEKGPEARRDLAARALLSLGRPGYEALRRFIAANPEFAKSVMATGDQPPPNALVRITPFANCAKIARDLVSAVPWPDAAAGSIRACGTLAEPFLWEALDAGDTATATRAARLLRELYTAPGALPGRASFALATELDRKRDFDVADRSLADFLKEEPISWILMSPRDERITLRLRGITLRDFFRIATPNLAAVPVGDLLILIPPDRVAWLELPNAVWAPSEIAPRLETALDALARGEEGPINGLTGVSVYHALKIAAMEGGEKFSARAIEIRKQLQQRVFFTGGVGDGGGPIISLDPVGEKTSETLMAFEKVAKFSVLVVSKDALASPPPAFRFRRIFAQLVAPALEFRVNYIR